MIRFFSSFFLVGLFIIDLSANSLDIPYIVEPSQSVPEKLTTKNIDELATILHTLKMGPSLRCSLKVRHQREVRKFSTGEKWIEMLEVKFVNDRGYGGIETKTFFPEGSTFTRSIKNSEFSGPVEEIKFESNDRLSHWLTIHHDGKGVLVWAEMGNIYKVNPCQLR
jgi:hypothetical protein